MAERVHRGQAASPGLAIGPLVRLPEAAAGGSRPIGSVAEEWARLEAAILQAESELMDLAAAESGMGEAILAFQLELLRDPTLAESAFAAIAGGSGATAAWHACLEPQIAAYREAEDDYFRARAADLTDLAERVAIALDDGTVAAGQFPNGAILLAADLAPSRFLVLDWRRLGGAALTAGSPASHVAMLARARGVPLVTGLGPDPEPADLAILDADAGLLYAAPAPAIRARYQERLARHREDAIALAETRRAPAITASGEPVEVMVNIDDPAAVDDATLTAADGVGLLRTEFLFIGQGRLPDEAQQLAAYTGLVRRLGGRPCVVRTLDIGGDKPLPGVSLPQESNPFLGLRGLRLCLERPELFRPQARALLRAAAVGPVKVMLPMVAVAAEVEEARAFFQRCLAELTAEGLEAAMPPLGIMVETPAAALTLDLLPADFYSIGSNDLTQYVMAASRDGAGRIAALSDPLQPAVLRLIAQVVEHGRAHDVPVSLCGDMAADPRGIAALLDLGLRRVSVAAAALGPVKRAIAAYGARG